MLVLFKLVSHWDGTNSRLVGDKGLRYKHDFLTIFIRASVLRGSCEFYFLAIKSRNGLNRAYLENTNFKTFVPRNLKFYTFGDLHTTKKC